MTTKQLQELANTKSMGAFYELCLQYKLNPAKVLKEVAKYRESLKKN